jgi:hypothetical protein
MSLHSLIASGGRVLVVGGSNQSWQMFRKHPQLVFWTGDRAEISRHVKAESFPSNMRGVVISRFIGHRELTPIMDEARKRNAIIMTAKNDGEIRRILEEVTTVPDVAEIPHREDKPTAAPVLLTAPRKGQLSRFIETNHQAELMSAAEARRLMPLALTAGIKTTEGSMIQGVQKFRRSLGIAIGSRALKSRTKTSRVAQTSLPPAPAPKEPTTKAQSPVSTKGISGLLSMLDDVVVSIALIKEEVVKLSSQSNEHDILKQKLAELLK